jgi:hypothetical protein
LILHIFRTSFTSKRSTGSKGVQLNGLNLEMNALGSSMLMLPSSIVGIPPPSSEMTLGKILQNMKRKLISSGPPSRKDWEFLNFLV